MALQVRRGTDLQRQLVVFREGELVYTTDTNELYIGDGETPGGLIIAGGEGIRDELLNNLDLNGFDLIGVGDINISGIVQADTFIGDGSNLTNLPNGIVEGSDYRINVIGDDSTIIVDSSLNTVSGNFIGNINSTETINVNTLSDINTGLRFNIFNGSINSPLSPSNFERKSIVWSSYDSNTETFVDNNFIIGYHQSDLSGYLSLTSADSNGDLFKTSIELDGKERKISLIGFENEVDLIVDGNERIISTKSNNLVIVTENVPTTSVGQVGDKIGMIAVDNDYLYRCVADYDGISDIWTRIAWTSGSW